MPPVPGFHVPLWAQLASGLIVPSSVAERARVAPRSAVRLPPELALPARAVAVYRDRPRSSDQAIVRPSESDLGLTPSDLAYLATITSTIPFEPAMLTISRLAAALWHIHLDGEAQLQLARDFFDDDAPIIETLAAFTRQGDNFVIFSEQQLFVAQRLLIDHARDGSIADGMTHDEVTALKRLIVAANTIIDESHAGLDEVTDPEVMLAYLIQNGAYFSRGNMLNSFARAYSLFVERADADADEDRVPLAEWVVAAHPLSLVEQFAAGHALQAVAHVLDEGRPVQERALVEGYALRTTQLAERMDDVRAMLVGSRDWYRNAFAADASLMDIAWETTPFMQRPFLALSSGQLVLLSPRSIVSWLSDGFYYRFLSLAQEKNVTDPGTSQEYTKYVGKLLEGWALDLVRSAYPGDRPPGAGHVHGEQLYGDAQLTPDVAINLGPDVVLVEVRSGYLTRNLRVNGNLDELRGDLDRVLLRKVRQLGNAIAAILDGRAIIPDINIAAVQRIWPIIVTANITQSEPLHDLIEASLPAAFNDVRVQTPLILDAEDLEGLMGMVEQGASLTGILAARQASPYNKLEFLRWALETPGAPTPEVRPTYALERWDRVVAAVLGVLQVDTP